MIIISQSRVWKKFFFLFYHSMAFLFLMNVKPDMEQQNTLSTRIQMISIHFLFTVAVYLDFILLFEWDCLGNMSGKCDFYGKTGHRDFLNFFIFIILSYLLKSHP